MIVVQRTMPSLMTRYKVIYSLDFGNDALLIILQ